MSEGVTKKFMYLNRKAPYGTIYALESLEVVLIGAAFEQEVSLVFIDDGVYQLKGNQNTSVNSGIGVKDFSKTYRALEDYDIDKLYVDKDSMIARGLTEGDFIVPVQVMDSAQLAELMQQQDVILSF
jgi:tRNA 2-thiouridine synthesizing protein C